MPIRASSQPKIDALVAELTDENPITRETAIAHLTLIGPRAVDRLVAVLASSPAAAVKIAVLRALESIANTRALDAVLASIEEHDVGVAVAAASAAAPFLRSPRSADVVDRLTRAALDGARPSQVRLAAIGALSGLQSATLKPLWKTLAEDPDSVVQAASARAAAGRRSSSRPEPARSITGTLDGSALDDPDTLRRTVAEGGPSAALPILHGLLERIRDREASEPPSRRVEWTRSRAAVHMVLARRGSRLALYDLRESLEGATAPLPVEFLAALTIVGDASCLEPIAVAYAKAATASPSAHDWWRRHLADAFHAIAKRERVTPRHAVMKKIGKRWGNLGRDLLRSNQ